MIDKNKVLSYDELVDIYSNYCNNINVNKVNLGYPTLEKNIRNFRKQEVLTVLAKSGVGKSILTLNCALNYIEASEEIALILSLEMSDFSIAERTMQIKLKLDGKLIEDAFVEKDFNIISNAKECKDKMNNLKIVPYRMSVQDIPEYVTFVTKKFRKNVGLIICDHVGLLKNTDFKRDPYNRVTDNMQRMYNYSKDLNVAIISVSQVGREDARKDNINLFSGKESGEVENSSDFVISFEVVSTSKDTTELNMLNQISESHLPYRLMKINILKNRRGSSYDPLYALFDTRTVIISEYHNNLLIKQKI